MHQLHWLAIASEIEGGAQNRVTRDDCFYRRLEKIEVQRNSELPGFYVVINRGRWGQFYVINEASLHLRKWISIFNSIGNFLSICRREHAEWLRRHTRQNTDCRIYDLCQLCDGLMTEELLQRKIQAFFSCQRHDTKAANGVPAEFKETFMDANR